MGLSYDDFDLSCLSPPFRPILFPMRNLTATICLTLAVVLGNAGMSWSAEPIKGYCLSGTKHSHYPILGRCSASYENGDYATALREWEPLAEQGDASIQTLVGSMYNEGKGVPQNDKTAVKWYRLAAEQGNAYAQYNLGLMYRKGQGVPQNDKTAVKWYRLAAEQGLADAQGNLGASYAFGNGVLKDFVYAHMWGNIAATNGNELGARLRDDFEKKMTPSDISAAQNLARECVRKKYKGC